MRHTVRPLQPGGCAFCESGALVVTVRFTRIVVRIRVMGASIRYYVFEDDDTIRRISTARFIRLTTDGSTDRFPEYANRRVRFVEIHLDSVEQRSTAVREAYFGHLRFDRRGRFDASEWIEVLMTGVDKFLARFEPPRNARELHAQAERLRIKRAHEWKPSRSLRSRLHLAVLGTARETSGNDRR